MTEYLIQEDTLRYFADAVREKAGISDEMSPDEIIREVYLLETDTDTGAPSTGVIFYDYDGTVLYSYTVKEARALTSLPEGPTINDTNLTFAGWTHSLEEVNSVMKILHVGAMYEAAKTQLVIEFNSVSTFTTTTELYFTQSVSNGVRINWGDGSTSTVSGTGRVNTSHTYAAYDKEYVIEFNIISGTLTFGNGYLFAKDLEFSKKSKICKKVVISAVNTILDEGCFSGLINCQSIIISKGITTIPEVAFSSNSITAAIIPNSVEYIYSNAFKRCEELSIFVLPNGVKAMTRYGGYYDYPFEYCSKLNTIIFPSSWGLSSSTFGNTSYFSTIYIMAETPPKLGTVFNYNGATVYVSYKSLNAYRTAEDWSVIADYIKPMPIQY